MHDFYFPLLLHGFYFLFLFFCMGYHIWDRWIGRKAPQPAPLERLLHAQIGTHCPKLGGSPQRQPTDGKLACLYWIRQVNTHFWERKSCTKKIPTWAAVSIKKKIIIKKSSNTVAWKMGTTRIFIEDQATTHSKKEE